MRARVFDVVGVAFRRVGRCGLEAVVTVGEHERGARDRARDGVDAIRGLEPEQLVDHAVVVTRGGQRLGVGAEQTRQAGREREAPDRVGVRARRPEQLQAVGLGLGERALVREDRGAEALERERADHARGLSRRDRSRR